MNLRSWSERERQAFADVIAVSLAASTGIRTEAGLRQATRLAMGAVRTFADHEVRWAVVLTPELAEDSMYRVVDKAKKATDRRRVKTKRGIRRRSVVVGALRRGDEGEQTSVQMSFLLMDRDQIADALRRYTRQGLAAAETAEVLRRCRALLDQYPTASNVTEALQILGISIEDWLAS